MNDELFKIPDSALLKLSRKEVSELKAQLKQTRIEKDELIKKCHKQTKVINQLANENQHLKKLTVQDGKEVKKEEMYNVIRKHNANLRNKIKTLRDEKDFLLNQLAKAQSQRTDS